MILENVENAVSKYYAFENRLIMSFIFDDRLLLYHDNVQIPLADNSWNKLTEGLRHAPMRDLPLNW